MRFLRANTTRGPSQLMYREEGGRDRYYERERGGGGGGGGGGGYRDNRGGDRRRESDGGGGWRDRGVGERDIDRKRPRNSYDSYDNRGGGRGMSFCFFIFVFVCNFVMFIANINLLQILFLHLFAYNCKDVHS